MTTPSLGGQVSIHLPQPLGSTSPHAPGERLRVAELSVYVKVVEARRFQVSQVGVGGHAGQQPGRHLGNKCFVRAGLGHDAQRNIEFAGQLVKVEARSRTRLYVYGQVGQLAG